MKARYEQIADIVMEAQPCKVLLTKFVAAKLYPSRIRGRRGVSRSTKGFRGMSGRF